MILTLLVFGPVLYQGWRMGRGVPGAHWRRALRYGVWMGVAVVALHVWMVASLEGPMPPAALVGWSIGGCLSWALWWVGLHWMAFGGGRLYRLLSVPLGRRVVRRKRAPLAPRPAAPRGDGARTRRLH